MVIVFVGRPALASSKTRSISSHRTELNPTSVFFNAVAAVLAHEDRLWSHAAALALDRFCATLSNLVGPHVIQEVPGHDQVLGERVMGKF